MLLKKIEISLIAGLCIAVVAGLSCVHMQEDIASKMIRLHVVANSDTAEDQALKLKVRDGVLSEVGTYLDGETQIETAAAEISQHIPQIEETAERILRENGCDLEVRAALKTEAFGTREYDTFTLPAGEYQSLRLTIGEAKGRNWWCVVFPPLCISAASEFEATAEAAGLTDEEISLITEDDGEVVFRFRFLEILQKIRDSLAGGSK